MICYLLIIENAKGSKNFKKEGFNEEAIYYLSNSRRLSRITHG